MNNYKRKGILEKFIVYYLENFSKTDISDSDDIRFSYYVEETVNCWLWKGYKIKGYGYFTKDGQTIAAHHYLWKIIHGDIPQYLELDHVCRNKLCVNPYHLELVTSQENKNRDILYRYNKSANFKNDGISENQKLKKRLKNKSVSYTKLKELNLLNVKYAK